MGEYNTVLKDCISNLGRVGGIINNSIVFDADMKIVKHLNPSHLVNMVALFGGL